MNLEKIFPDVSFTVSELQEIATALTRPSVIKYCKSEQISAFKAIANGQPKEGESDAEYLRRQAQVVGQLQVWEAILSVEKPTDPSPSS